MSVKFWKENRAEYTLNGKEMHTWHLYERRDNKGKILTKCEYRPSDLRLLVLRFNRDYLRNMNYMRLYRSKKCTLVFYAGTRMSQCIELSHSGSVKMVVLLYLVVYKFRKKAQQLKQSHWDRRMIEVDRVLLQCQFYNDLCSLVKKFL
jgi:hypothetical protein